MKKTALIIGSKSDIGLEIAHRLAQDEWEVHGWARGDSVFKLYHHWDLFVCALGTLEPIGNFFQTDQQEWERNVTSNALLPLQLLRRAWPFANPGASVCFFSGAGTSNSAKTYSGYSASKMMLYKMTELLDDEEPDVKFFILGPGMVRTKIQNQTLNAGNKAANFERVSKFMTEGDERHKTGTSHDRIYECLQWCMSLEKEVVGGKNFYVPDFPFSKEVQERLRTDRRFFKLRRLE